MILSEVLNGLQLNPWTVVSVIDADSDKYLKGGYVNEVLARYPKYTVVRTVVSLDGMLRFWVRK